MGGVKLGGSTSRVLSNWVRITSAERSVRSMFSCAVRTACVLTCAQTKQRQKQQQHQSTNPEAVTRGALAVRSRETKAAPSERVGEEAHLDGAHGGVERGEAAVEGAEYGDDGVGDLLALLQRLPQQRRALRQALHLHRRHPLPGLRTHRETVSRRGGWIWRRRGSERGAVSPVWLRRADDKDRVGVGEQGGRTPRWRPEQARAAAGGASSSKHTQLHKKQLALALASEKRARRTERAAAAAAAACLSSCCPAWTDWLWNILFSPTWSSRRSRFCIGGRKVLLFFYHPPRYAVSFTIFPRTLFEWFYCYETINTRNKI
jgi:hypothetical protein